MFNNRTFQRVILLCLLLGTALTAACGRGTPAPDGVPAGASSPASTPHSGSPADSPSPAADTPAAPTAARPTEVPPTEQPTEQPTEPPSEAERLLAQMTVREKVGQLFIVRPEALDGSSGAVTAVTDALAAALRTYPVGGCILFRANIVSPDQILSLNGALQAASGIPLFLGVDEEGGRVTRLACNPAFSLPRYESAAAVGDTGDPDAALSMGRTVGAYLRQYGFNMDFAPVADVSTNPDNPAIGDRAFSADADTAAQMAAAMAAGLRREGIIPVWKHFPGHGDTAEDSHLQLAVTYKTEAQMQSCEWIPFAAAPDSDGIMVGHVATPNIEDELCPATMSYKLVTEILRGTIGFQGLIITDALEMGAITNTYGPGEAAVRAFLAGCDILLLPADLPAAFDALLQAVEDGTVSVERLDASVLRILQYKTALRAGPTA